MIYMFQRIIKNEYQWMRPSPGRLGKKGNGDHLEKYGFGQEDWNFNEALAIDGFMYGYLYYKPTEKKKTRSLILFLLSTKIQSGN